jgi:hypothetical protein
MAELNETGKPRLLLKGGVEMVAQEAKNRRASVRLLMQWLGIVSVCLVMSVSLSVFGTLKAYHNTARICTAFTSLINDNRMSLDDRMTAIHDKTGIYATYTPTQLTAAISVIDHQLKSFPPYHC